MPINFACPHCGKQTTVADQYAGQAGPCAACGKNITVPFSAGVGYSGPATQGSGGGAGMALAITAVVLVIGLLVCGGIGVALLIPAVASTRSASQRMMS